MIMPFGYNGKILHVNLTDQTFSVEEPPEAFYRKYAGGSALGLYYLLHDMPPRVDALAPENILVLSVSVLTGVPISGQSRLMANAKSPLTGAIGDSQSGGFFPAELKFAGYDALVLSGKAVHPIYLWIKDGAVEFRDARHLWGKLTGEAERMIREELGDGKIQVAQAGPSGEKGVRFAAIMNMSNRANGRTGMGAVMGSKNVKAIAVRGPRGPSRVSVADKRALIELTQWGTKQIPVQPDMASLGKYGTSDVLIHQHLNGGLPTHNYDSGAFDAAAAISGEALYDTLLRGAGHGRQSTQGRDTCFACAVRCKRVVESEYAGKPIEPHYGGPEYETLATFGSYCGVSDLRAAAMASQLCNQYGVDSISAGATIAFAMDCFEHGLVTREDAGGLDLSFGNADAMVTLTEQMLARSSPLGDLLAEGSARAAQAIGRGAEDLVVAVKGQELPAHMPQVKRALGVIYAVNPFGADHQSSGHDPAYELGKTDKFYLNHLAEIGLTTPQPVTSLSEEKIRYMLLTQQVYSALDSFGLCQFVWGPTWQLYGPRQMVELIRAVTGWDYTVEEMLRVGELRLNLMRAFNAREGIGRAQDTLPKKLFKPLKDGATDGVKLSQAEMQRAQDMYYALAGWDVETGTPSVEKLEQLGIEWALTPTTLPPP